MKNKTDTEYWDYRREKILSKKGGWVLGKGISLYQHSLLDDLLGAASFYQVVILGITGRLPDQRFSKWLEATFICMSWPDPRIWCNQVSTFGGELRSSSVSSIAAGLLSSESSMYGTGAGLAAFDFIDSAYQFCEHQGTVADYIETVAKTRIGLQAPGFGRPIAKGDERVTAMLEYSSTLDFSHGRHMALALEIEKYLQENYQESMNLAGYMCAFALDQGYTKTEMHRIISTCVNGGLHSCFAEGRDQASDSFLPLRCNDIEYTGPDERRIRPQGGHK
jgi:hypothetical protein